VWLYVTPEGRTIKLKNRPALQPIFFHGHDDGKQRGLTITQVTADSVAGYLMFYPAR
jgi:hypothetical protein